MRLLSQPCVAGSVIFDEFLKLLRENFVFDSPKASVALVWMMRMAKFLGLDEVKEWFEGGDIPGARLPGRVDALD